MDDKIQIDVDKIRDQVRREVMAEEKYWRENDAKMRAVEQRVPTYEDFKQIVMASHLKPLDKGETLRNAKLLNNNTWNPSALHSSSTVALTSEEQAANLSSQAQATAASSKPKTSQEFRKTWQKLSDMDSKWTFLISIGHDALTSQFKAEINSDQLSEFVVLIDRKLQSNSSCLDSANLAFTLLRLFSECKRFSLNKMFLKPAEKDSFKNAIQLLKTLITGQDQPAAIFCPADLQKLETLI